MTVKIQVDGRLLRELLEKCPEVEVELTKQAAAQVAEVFKRKVNFDTLFEQVTEKINKELSYRYHMPEPVKNSIRSEAKEAAGREVEEKFRLAYSQELEKVAAKQASAMEARLSDRIDKMVMAAFDRAVRAAASVGGRK